MTTTQAENMKRMLGLEKKQVNDLRKLYTQALAETRHALKTQMDRIPTADTAQTIAYRIDYQKAMEKQLKLTLNRLDGGEANSIRDYLNQVYDHGFYGTNYSLYRQGVPVSLGVDPGKVVAAIEQKTDGYKFSQRIHSNVQLLGESVRDGIAHGFASGLSYADMAQRIALGMDMDLRRAERIVRTEGARVQGIARQNAMEQAKEKGADIVKEWSSTLDSKTRPEHGELDGQIVEIDGYFVIDGMRAQRPCGFNDPGMDINCRCVVLERSRVLVEYEAQHGRSGTRWDQEAGITIPDMSYSQWRKSNGI